MAKYMYTALGLMLVVIATIGVVLPVLPTTPILLLAAICFAKGSPRVETWFVESSLYKNHAQSFVESREMKLSTKLGICIPVTFMMLIPFIIMNNIYGRTFIICALLFKYYYFTFRIKTI